MRSTLIRVAGALGLAFASSAIAPPLGADEGQWTPDQIAALDRAQLTRMGLEITSEALFSAEGGLMRAAVNLSGCSAAFISKRGLIVTNHHCALRAIQAQSTPEKDHLKHGFVAKTAADELEAKGYTVTVLRGITDVTERVRKAASAAKSDLERWTAVDREGKVIVEECEKGGARCQVAEFYGGAVFRLFQSVELRDVRLVYAPPSAIGNYGGEVDNWMWPRHTGDFALLRAYAGKDGAPADHSSENVPFVPEFSLEVSADGVRPGDFVAVMGYPGRTERHLGEPGARYQVEQALPRTVDLYGEWLEILARHSEKDRAVALRLAATKRALENRHKNSRGMLDGIRRIELLDRKRREREKLLGLAKTGSEHAGVVEGIDEVWARRTANFERDFLLASVDRGPALLGVAVDIVRRARERAKPDLERPMRYQDRNAERQWKVVERRLGDFVLDADAELVASLGARAAKLREGAGVPALAALAGGGRPERARIAPSVRAKHVASRLPKIAKELWDAADAGAIEKHADPIIALARGVADALTASEADEHALGGRMLDLGPKLFDMLRKVRTGPVYPDANGTLRLSYASVIGYSPREGLSATPQTTLSGAVEKHTGQDPFDMPARVREIATAAKETHWADPELRDVPLCFLSNADTTGGNSGSPVIDGRGRLVGLNFDRVWENIAGDFGYSTSRSRNISVDVRYMLWLLDRVEDANALLEEMGVSEFRAAGRRTAHVKRGAGAATLPASGAADGSAGAPGTRSCGCGAVRRDEGDSRIAWVAGCALLVLLRRGCSRRGGKADPRASVWSRHAAPRG